MELYLVGGAVRDLLLGRAPEDLDFAFSGTTEAFLSAHPDATRVGKSVSVCLWRGRECSALRGDSLAADLRARDLTINALALDGAGRLHMHPQAVADLRHRLLRPASPHAFTDDPARIFRLARFAAQWPDWRIDGDAFGQMRAAPPARLAALPAERVGRELGKALSAPRPGRFFRVLAQGKCLTPWFPELERAAAIPAGPSPWHRRSVLGHSLRLMDAVAGDVLAAWMALCHDLGKIRTEPAHWPHHYGHERAGVPLARALASRLHLPAAFLQAGAIAAEEHMKAGMYPHLRPGTQRDLLWRVHGARLDAPFWKLADADSGQAVGAAAQADLAALLRLRLPEEWRGRGTASAQKLREMHCQTLAERRARGRPIPPHGRPA